MVNKNSRLHTAKNAKKDEFYTQLSDIENEMKHYKNHFKGKVVYCNCDDPGVSNFFKFFSNNFEHFGLKKLITTCYKNQDRDLFSRHDSEKAIWLECEGTENENQIPSREETKVRHLKRDGDFRSAECIELLKQADIVVTNPPFSLFREYVAQLMEYDKKFVIIGSMNAITYKETFQLIKEGKLWTGHLPKGGEMGFGVADGHDLTELKSRMDQDGNELAVVAVRWFTNLDYGERHEDLFIHKKYDPAIYPKYDNYDAINVNKTKEIPVDYDGAMGVPISFLDKFNPDQFEILSCNDYRENGAVPFKEHGLIKDKDGTIDGKAKYVRIVIRKKTKSCK